MKLLIYNPDTDYALASGSDFYTPPASVKALMANNPFQAEAWGNENDLILLPDWIVAGNSLPIVKSPLGLSVVTDSEIKEWSAEKWSEIDGIEPWGWNMALRHRLAEARVPCHLLPDAEKIKTLRNLAHRRTTIPFNRMMGTQNLPVELGSEEECIEFWQQNPGCWFKAPWSSSGRGVIGTAELMQHHIRPWVRGIIRRQGSVMAEPGVDKLCDFATEWTIGNGMPEFRGFSYFKVSGRGKYISNYPLSQAEILSALNAQSNFTVESAVAEQKNAIAILIAPYYDGPLGIDMMITRSGGIVPCVEINLRRTMGHISLQRK